MLLKFLLFLSLLLSLYGAESEKSYFVYDCSDNYRFVAEVSDAGVWLFLPERTVQVLKRRDAYAVGDVLYRPTGEDATLTVGKKRYSCHNDRVAAKFERAKFRGVAFRAIGNEPGWVLEIIPDREVRFITHLGTLTTYFKIEQHYEMHNSTEYKLRSKNNLLYLRIEKRRCFDTMSGREYESSVYLNFDGNELRGCGKGLF